MKPLPNYTVAQLETLDVLRRNRMAWIMFIFLLFVFLGLLGFVLYGLVTGSMRCGMETFTLLGLDGIIGWSLRAVVSWLFPSTFTAKPSEG
jgi:fluoride ion exporter CrcB/FEX